MKTNRLLHFFLLTAISLPAKAQLCLPAEKPQPGKVVSFTYSPQGTPLAADTSVEGRFVRYNTPTTMHLSRPMTVTLVRQGTDFVGQVTIPKKDAAGIMMLFRSKKMPQRIDVNRGQLYVIPVYDSTGTGRLIPHAIGGQASVFMRSNFLYEANGKPDLNHIVRLYEQELAQHPDLRPQYWADYLLALIRQKKPGYGPTVKAGIVAYLASRPTPTATELTDAARLYETMGDFASANAQRERMKTLDPAGSLVQKDRATAVRNAPDWPRKKAAYAAFVKEFPGSSYIPGLGVVMTDGYFKNNDISGLVAFVGQQPDSHLDGQVLNTIAYQLAEERRSLPEAELLARRALDALKNQPKPAKTNTTQEAEKATRQRLLTATLAHTLEQQGKYADAYATYSPVVSVEDIDNSDPRVNERYFTCAVQSNHGSDARPLAEAAIQIGKATPRLKTTLHDWYAKQPGQNAAKADAYLTELEADLRADMRDELQQTLINEPAPAFSLTDLQGRTISSSALKGKVVVVDFWATWCGPCIASFPAMQQAKTRFQSDPNVRFLFVNTREGGPVQRVHDFMNKHPYDFVVPLDGQQRMANAYKVQGIPTKVVIDTKGRVRYRAIGYSGDPETTVNELTLVVELLKEGK